MALIYVRIKFAVFTNDGQRKAVFVFFLPEQLFWLSFLSFMVLKHNTEITRFCFVGLNEADETALRLLLKLEVCAGGWSGSS